jgi:hypothetical protein
MDMTVVGPELVNREVTMMDSRKLVKEENMGGTSNFSGLKLQILASQTEKRL